MDPESNVDQTGEQTNAQTNPQGGESPKEQPVSPRLLAMEAIKVRREGEEEEGEQSQQQAQTADQLAQQTAPEPVVLADGFDRTLVRVKVDGVESLVPLADVVGRFQKNEAADKRLAEAARLKAEAEALAQQAKPPVGVDGTPQGGQTAPTSSSEGGDAGQAAKEFLRALFDGDEDKAAERLQELVSGGRAQGPTQMDPNTIAAQLTPAIRQQLLNESALESFLDANPVIASDPHLTQMTAGFLDEELKGGKAYPDALAEAGRRTSDWMARLGVTSAAGSADPTTSREDKLARKGRMDDIQPASTSASTTVATPMTPSQTIMEMRKARGLPV